MSDRLIEKWSKTGLLLKVKLENLETVVARLEAKAQAVIDISRLFPKSEQSKEAYDLFEQEIIKMRDEGLFGETE